MKYTYSDEEDDIYSDSTNTRRSTRNTGTHTPAEQSGPTITQSGRQVKSRHGGAYGESILSETHGPTVSTSGGFDGTSEEPEADGSGGRPRRAAAAAATNGWTAKGGRHIEGYNDVDEMTSDDEGDASEQDYGDDEEEDVPLESDVEDPADLTDEDEDLNEAGEKKKLIVKLPVKTPTPEKITTTKLSLTPERDSAKSSSLFPSILSNKNASTSSTNAVSRANSSTVGTKENTQPTSSSDMTNTTAQPISIPPKSPPHQTQTAPLSPLAFRGSPEKLPAFPPSVLDLGELKSRS